MSKPTGQTVWQWVANVVVTIVLASLASYLTASKNLSYFQGKVDETLATIVKSDELQTAHINAIEQTGTMLAKVNAKEVAVLTIRSENIALRMNESEKLNIRISTLMDAIGPVLIEVKQELRDLRERK